MHIYWREPRSHGRIRTDDSLAETPLMIVEFAPLIFGTAGLLAIFLFFALAEH
jgi:hypothetical protein